MLRQKRRAENKQSTNNKLNLYSNENLQKMMPKDFNFLVTKISLSQAKNLRNRTSLRQITTNQNMGISENKSIQISETKYFPVSKERNEADFFGKIVKLIKTQDLKIPASHLSRAKSFLMVKKRPYSSFSQRNRKASDYSSFCQGHIILKVDKKDQSQPIQVPERMSTSRALMAFSKINRNYSGQRFKVKRDKHLNQGPMCVETQRVILQQKQRKQNNFLDKNLEISTSLSKQFGKKKQKNVLNSRYKAEQDFELGGWEYFQ